MSRKEPKLEGSPEGEGGERMTSSTSGGVLANDDAGEEYGESDRSGSKFKNSIQSRSKVGSPGCSRSSWGISNKAEKASAGVVTSTEDAL